MNLDEIAHKLSYLPDFVDAPTIERKLEDNPQVKCNVCKMPTSIIDVILLQNYIYCEGRYAHLLSLHKCGNPICGAFMTIPLDNDLNQIKNPEETP